MKKYDDLVEFWQHKNIKTSEQLEQALDNFRILFAYHSGKIENKEINFHDTREIFENGKVLNFTGDPRNLFEQQNQKLCYPKRRKTPWFTYRDIRRKFLAVAIYRM